MKIRDKIVLRNLLKEGDHAAVIREIDPLIETDPNSYLYHMKAQALYNLGRYNESLDCIRRAFSFSNAGNELLLLAGRIYFRLHYYRKAEEFYVHSLKAHSGSVETLAAYSFLLFIIGYIDKAYTVLDKARESEEFNIYTMCAEAMISLYSAGFKEESRLIETILSRVYGDTFESINSGLILRLNKNSREAKRIFTRLYHEAEHDTELYAALITLCGVPPYFRKKSRDDTSFLYGAAFAAAITGAAAYVLITFGSFQTAIPAAGGIAFLALAFIVYKVIRLSFLKT
ncbi:MAG: tetratricopeptide repeat protein [Spirochaetota bacterium]